MYFLRVAILLVAFLTLVLTPFAVQAGGEPRHFVFIGGDEARSHAELLDRPDIEGAQIVYSWKILEPEEGVYDFSAIEADLSALDALNKKLFVQIQDRFFSSQDRLVPDYILVEEKYEGGLARQFDNAGEDEPIGHGWTAKQWNPALRERFQALLQALSTRFDGRIYGINLPESAFDAVATEGEEDSFTCDGYFAGALENMRALRAAFRETNVVQYINFWPCEWDNDHGYMERAFALAIELGIGVGGPDIVPYRRAHMSNSYPYFHRHKDDLPLIAMAVQEPTLTYTNPETGVRFSRDELVDFAQDYLGADIIFWSKEASWLNSREDNDERPPTWK